MAQEFAGFPEDFFAFLRDIAANNNRVWFEANKARFRNSVQAPLSAFITALAPRLAQISEHFVADPRPNGRSIFRIYRDVRFSKDKRPYKENAACAFSHDLGRSVTAPSFYVHLAPGEVFFGGGLYMPPPDALATVRTAIADQPQAWRAVLADKTFSRVFGEIRGERLKRPPEGFAADHPLIEDIKRKGFYVMHEGDETLARSPAVIGAAGDAFAAADPLMRFLCGALGAPY